jgi:hypothetical protein
MQFWSRCVGRRKGGGQDQLAVVDMQMPLAHCLANFHLYDERFALFVLLPVASVF